MSGHDHRLVWIAVLALVMVVALPEAISFGRDVSDRLAHRDWPMGAFTDVTEEAGLAASHTGIRGRSDEWAMPVTGQAWGDFDRDGSVDLYLTDQRGRSTLYRNEGDGTFALSPLGRDVALPAGNSASGVFVDYDNDGWSDLYVTGFGEHHLFHNDSGAGFSEVELPPVGDVKAMTASWADYDGDGWLDFFVATYGCTECGEPRYDRGDPNRLFHNERGRGFTDVTASLPDAGGAGFTFLGAWLDYDNDGRLDLYVAKDVFGSSHQPPNALIRNDGPGCGHWCFTDVSAGSGADVRADAMGIAVGDYNNDGKLDLYFSNSGGSRTGPPRLLANLGDVGFGNVPGAGVDADVFSWGTEFLDFDNDGWRDLYLAVGGGRQAGRNVQHSVVPSVDRLFRNRGNGSFENFTDRAGTFDDLASLGVATADYNNDGRVDVAVGNYDVGYRLYAGAGEYGRDNNRLVVRLTGGGPVNRDAVGARVRVVTADGHTQMQDVRIGSSLGAGSDTALAFGLGRAEPTRVTVQWPDGREETLTDVPANSLVALRYGDEASIMPLAEQTVEGRIAPHLPLPGLTVAGAAAALIAVASTIAFGFLLGAALVDGERAAPATVETA